VQPDRVAQGLKHVGDRRNACGFGARQSFAWRGADWSGGFAHSRIVAWFEKNGIRVVFEGSSG
jgi:hypothetical protein